MRKFGVYPTNVVRYFYKHVIDGVTHTHKKGFCHRDLKPWNVMLSDDLSVSKVIDYSYAVSLDKEEFTKNTPKILKGYLPGTKAYMAPE